MDLRSYSILSLHERIRCNSCWTEWEIEVINSRKAWISASKNNDSNYTLIVLRRSLGECNNAKWVWFNHWWSSICMQRLRTPWTMVVQGKKSLCFHSYIINTIWKINKQLHQYTKDSSFQKWIWNGPWYHTYSRCYYQNS